MSDVSYKVKMTTSAAKREEAKKVFEELLDKWESTPGDYDMEDVVLDFDEVSGGFVFNTNGVKSISPALMDDTGLILKQMGGYAEKGALVQHMYNGKWNNFAVGPSAEAKKAAMESAEILFAVEHLEKAKEHTPNNMAADIDKIIDALEELL